MFVTLDIVRKSMEKHKRCVFYLKDDKGDLVHGSEECDNWETAYSELEEYVQGCVGSFCIVELPKEAKGKSSRGGNRLTLEESKFVYKVKLGTPKGGNNDMGGGLSGNTALSIIMKLMDEKKDAEKELDRERSKREMDELRREMKDIKKGKDNGLEGFAKLVMEEYREGKRVQGIADNVKAKHAQPQPEPEQVGTINEEVKAPDPKKEKLKGALNTFKEIDPNYVDNVAFLAEYAKKNPGIYKDFIAGLKGTP